MKPYYEDAHSGITIYHGDCREVLPNISGVRCTVTSPPYNTLGARMPTSGTGKMRGDAWLAKVNSRGYADDLDEDTYAEWQRQVALMVADAGTADASFFYNHKVRYRGGVLVHPLDIVRSFGQWVVRQEIIWARDGGIAFNARMFCPSDERVYWLVRPSSPGIGTPGGYVWNQSSSANMTVWRIRQEMGVDGHPCPYPPSLPKRCIAATTEPGDVVLDPFMGSGTTLRAAKDLGRKAIGIELEERYCEIAAKRLAQGVLDFGASA